MTEDAAHSSQRKQSQLGAPYIPGPAAAQKCSIIDRQRSAQGGSVTKCCFMSEANEIFNRVATEGK